MSKSSDARSARASIAYDRLATDLRAGDETAIAVAKRAIWYGVEVATKEALADICEMLAAMAASELSDDCRCNGDADSTGRCEICRKPKR